MGREYNTRHDKCEPKHSKCYNRQPNVVVILVDDQARANIGAYGDPYINSVVIDGKKGGTNNIDKLYRQSVRLQDFHSAPVCTPTRASLLTGRYNLRTNGFVQLGVGLPLRLDETTMADVFKSNGYKTQIVGKWHLGAAPGFSPNDRGFDDGLYVDGGAGGLVDQPWNFDNVYSYSLFDNGNPVTFKGDLDGNGFITQTLFERSMKFIEDNKDNKFFCYVSTIAPHWAYRCPPKYSQAYKDIGVRGYDDLVVQGTAFANPTNFGANSEYYGMISIVDKYIGQLRQKLRDLKLEDDTIVMFMTDNGLSPNLVADNPCNPLGPFDNYFGTPPLRGIKNSPYEGGHRAAGFWYYPNGKICGGRDVQDLSLHIDVLPTLIDLCRLKCVKTKPLDGKSLAKILKCECSKLKDRTVFVQNPAANPVFQAPIKGLNVAIMRGSWRLVKSDLAQDGNPGVFELYDLEVDPSQENNVINMYPQLVDKLMLQYDAYWADTTSQYDPNNLFDRPLYQLGTTNKQWVLNGTYSTISLPTEQVAAATNGRLPSHTNGGLGDVNRDAMNYRPATDPYVIENIACDMVLNFTLHPDANPLTMWRVNIVNTGNYEFIFRRFPTSRSYADPISTDPLDINDPANPNSRDHYDWLFPYNEQTPIAFADYYDEAILSIESSTVPGLVLQQWRQPIITGTVESIFNVQITTLGPVIFRATFTRTGNDPISGEPLNPKDVAYVYVTYLD